MGKREIRVENKNNGAVLATAVKDEGVQLFEGAWYFDPQFVDDTDLIVTERTYVCPYKGTCYWIDLRTADGVIENVAFTYFDILPGYEFIRDQIGFYAGERPGTRQTAQDVA